MATTLPLVGGLGLSDGEYHTAEEMRWAMLSAFDVAGGSVGNLSRCGILPAGASSQAGATLGRLAGLLVTPQGSPAMSVNVAPGKIAIQPNSAATPPFGASLASAGVLDGFGAAHATVARTDLIIAEAQVTGTGASLAQLRILPGTNGSSARPTLPTTPGVTHAVAIATVTIQPLSIRPSSNIQASDISWVQSDTWTKDTSDVGYMAGVGGQVITPAGLLAMTATRRNAWSALHADGTRWIDLTTGCEGYIRGGLAVPTTERMLSYFYDASAVNAATLTPDLATHPALTLIGGVRLIEITASVIMRGTAHAGARASITAMDAPYMQQEVNGVSGDYYHTASKTWKFTVASGAIAANAWKVIGARDGGSGTVTFEQRLLVIMDKGPGVG